MIYKNTFYKILQKTGYFCKFINSIKEFIVKFGLTQDLILPDECCDQLGLIYEICSTKISRAGCFKGFDYSSYDPGEYSGELDHHLCPF
jgi:hypothetical protein